MAFTRETSATWREPDRYIDAEELRILIEIHEQVRDLLELKQLIEQLNQSPPSQSPKGE